MPSLTQRWNELTNREDQELVNYGLQAETSVQFCQVEGRWYSKVSITVQGVRVANYYYEVLDNEQVNMLNSVSGQCKSGWQRQAQEQLSAASQAVDQAADGGM